MQQKFFNVAKAVAKTSQYPRIKIGCCIVKKNKILAVGVNQLKSHPMQKRYNKFRPLNNDNINNNIHAELDAVIKCNKDDLIGASIYVYRESSDTQLRMCKPCEACTELIKRCGIKTIYYTDVDGYYSRLL